MKILGTHHTTYKGIRGEDSFDFKVGKRTRPDESLEVCRKKHRKRRRLRKRRVPTFQELLARRADCLRVAGFEEVANVMDGDGGDNFPWDEIRALSSPLLMHQMIQFCDLLIFQGVVLDEYPTRQCIHYLLEACRSAIEGKDRENPLPNLDFGENWQIDSACRLLAMAIFLGDRTAQGVLDACKGASATGFTHALEFLFNAKMRQLNTALTRLDRSPAEARLHSQVLYQDQVLCFEVAKMMVTQDGRVNIGIGPLLPEKLHFERRPQRAFLVEMCERFVALKEDSDLWAALEALEVPEGPADRSAWLIRASVRKWNQEIPLEKADAVRAGLMALLSHLRQGFVGSCFATAVAIQLARWDPIQVVEDIRQLFSDGVLKREVEGEEWSFPFLLRFSKERLNKELLLAPDGTLLGEGIKIWEVAGVRAACGAFGLEPEETCKGLLADKMWRIDLQAWLKIIGSVGGGGPLVFGQSKEEARMLATYIFTSHTENPVLRAWEYAMASMVEARTTDVITAFDMDNTSLKGRAIHSIVEGLTPYLDRLTGARSKLTGLLLKAITEQLVKGIQYVYDPQVKHRGTSGDGHSSLGAFVMYDRRFMDSKEVMLPGAITTPKACQEFISYLVGEACDTVEGHPFTRFLGFNLDRCRNALKDYVSGDEFLVRAHNIFSYKNPASGDIFTKPERVPHTFWVDRRGGDPRELELIYFGQEKWGPHDQLEPFTAQELLEKVVGWVRRQPPEYRKLVSEWDDWPLLSGSPTHAFSVFPGSPSLKGLWAPDVKPRDWIKENILPSARRIANAAISVREKEALVRALRPFISAEFYKKLQEVVAKLPEGVTRKEFRNQLLHLAEGEGLCLRAMTRGQKGKIKTLRLEPPRILSSAAITSLIDGCAQLVAESQREAFKQEAGKLVESLKQDELRKNLSLMLSRHGVQVVDLVDFNKKERKGTSKPFSKAQVGLYLDMILYENLPETEKACIREKSFLLADTNWRNKGRDLHFIIQINPGTGELVFWATAEGDKFRRPLDQSSWLKGSYWPWTLWPREAVLKV